MLLRCCQLRCEVKVFPSPLVGHLRSVLSVFVFEKRPGLTSRVLGPSIRCSEEHTPVIVELVAIFKALG